jgi:hypothetical protein
LDATSDWNHVTGSPVGRIDGGQNVVEESALVKLGVFDVGLKREEAARHFDHVVNVAGLGGAPVDAITQRVGRATSGTAGVMAFLICCAGAGPATTNATMTNLTTRFLI